jgi:hypothetical protein
MSTRAPSSTIFNSASAKAAPISKWFVHHQYLMLAKATELLDAVIVLFVKVSVVASYLE